MGQGDPANPRYGILGSNFRMGEIEAAITLEQLPKLRERAASRAQAAARLNASLSGLPGLRAPHVDAGNSHVYYIYGMTLEEDLAAARSRIVDALRAEGVPALMTGYQNLHRLPLFMDKLAYGHKGFPYVDSESRMTACPVAENLHNSSFFGMLLCAHEFDEPQTNLIVESFGKVWGCIDRLTS